MCITAYLSYTQCDCTLVRYYFCHSHIKHTWKQIDTNPCSYAAHRHILLDTRGCPDYLDADFHALASLYGQGNVAMKKESGAPIGCLDLHKEEFSFATRILRRADLRFLELGEGGYMSEECRSGRFMMSDEHSCRLGVGIGYLWAHNTDMDTSQVHSPEALKSLRQLAQEDMDERYKQEEIAKFRRFRKYVDEEKKKKSLSASERLTIETIEKNFEKKVGRKTARSEKRNADHREDGRRGSVKVVKFADISDGEEAAFAAEYVSQNGSDRSDKVIKREEDMELE